MEFALRWSVCEMLRSRPPLPKNVSCYADSERVTNIKFVLNHTKYLVAMCSTPFSPRTHFFHLLSLTKFYIFARKFALEMGFYYDDVAIYSDSMIYSNLTCFHQIKLVARVVECSLNHDFLTNRQLNLLPFPALHHFVINANICNRLDWIKRDRKSSTNNFLPSAFSTPNALRVGFEKHQNLLTYRFLRVENLHLNDILGNHQDFSSGLFASKFVRSLRRIVWKGVVV